MSVRKSYLLVGAVKYPVRITFQEILIDSIIVDIFGQGKSLKLICFFFS